MDLNLAVLIKKEVYAIKRVLRRIYLIWFKTEYVRQQIQSRKGICGKHGCCDLTILSRIASKNCLSSSDSTICLRWTELNFICKAYPIDEKDKIPETLGYCNFYWE